MTSGNPLQLTNRFTKEDVMTKLRISRRDFLKFSAGAAAASLLAPPHQLTRVSAWQATKLRESMWDGVEVKPQVEEIMQGFKDKFGAEVDIEYNPDTYDDKILAGLA